jgi:pyruvate/2-oxoglutarate dehydrogenase complex dihydrolipoamide dehydrogenase (E3) component
VLLIDRTARLGGVPAHYVPRDGGVPTFGVWTRGQVLFGQEYVRRLTERLDQTETERALETEVLGAHRTQRELTVLSPRLGKKTIAADAIVLACGAREKSRAERAWIHGTRPARVFYTLQLLQLLDANELLPTRQPIVLGSDLIGFSAAAMLRAAGAESALIIDRRSRPRSTLLERLYFHRWGRSPWRPAERFVQIEGEGSAHGVRLDESDSRACDGVVLSGELVPNSGLAIAAGLEVRMPERVPVVRSRSELSERGWFAAGNVLGGFHGAERCYLNGLGVARAVARYLSAR